MTAGADRDYLLGLVRELCKLPHETDWVEFKLNQDAPRVIGEYLSALANAATLHGKAQAYLLWGVENGTHAIAGTGFSPAAAKTGNEPLETWLLRLLSPRIDFRFHEVMADGRRVILLEIDRASRQPVAFNVRELVANALIHQDFLATGAGPLVEIFQGRIEITNPGEPLVDTQRFLDSPPTSRNEVLASLMRRFRICEERGSGIDKVVAAIERYHLPAPLFETPPNFTRVVLFAHKALADIDKRERERACYLHACLKYVQRDSMTNASIRERFGIDERNRSTASRLIRDVLEAGLVAARLPEAPPKYREYIPFWASSKLG